MIIEYLNSLLKGRGFFASFLVISGWGYTAILAIVIFYRIFMCLSKSKGSKAEGE